MLKNDYNESDNQLELEYPENNHEADLAVNLEDTPKENLEDTPKDNLEDTPKENLEDTPQDFLGDLIKQEVSTCPKSTIINLHPNVYKLLEALQEDLKGVRTSSTPSAAVKHLLLFWYGMSHKYDVSRQDIANTMLQGHRHYNKRIISGKLSLKHID